MVARIRVFARHARKDNVLGTTAFQMLAGGVIMTAAGTVLGEWPHLYFTRRTAIALVYLSTIGAVGGFVAYTYALRHLPVSFVSLYAYINPVIAVALGVLFLHESFDSRMAVAAALVFARRGRGSLDGTANGLGFRSRSAGLSRGSLNGAGRTGSIPRCSRRRPECHPQRPAPARRDVERAAVARGAR